jgi:signal transduction histidine kinase
VPSASLGAVEVLPSLPLHDSAGQTLAALGMNLTQLAEDSKGNPAQFAEDVKAKALLIKDK